MILVTGGTGIVGAHILFELLHDGKEVRALLRSTSSKQVVKDLFCYYSPDGANLFSKIEWVEGDICDSSNMEEAVKNCTAVFHAAAFVSFSGADFKKLSKVNAEGTSNVVNACLAEGVSEFYYVSSVAALGRSAKKQEIDEETEWEPSKENSGYAVSKRNAEMEVWRGGEEGLKIAIINPTIVIGPGRTDSSSGTIFRSINRGQKFFTLGENGFVDARDVAFILKRLFDLKKFNERYVLVGENLSYKEVSVLMATHLKVKEPSSAASNWMTGLAWRILWVKSKLTGKPALLTRESARSSHRISKYKNDKVRNELGITFRTAAQAIDNATAFFREFPSHLK